MKTGLKNAFVAGGLTLATLVPSMAFAECPQTQQERAIALQAKNTELATVRDENWQIAQAIQMSRGAIQNYDELLAKPQFIAERTASLETNRSDLKKDLNEKNPQHQAIQAYIEQLRKEVQELRACEY